MRPDFKVVADTQDVTAVIRSRLVSLEIVDEAGVQSDSAEIVLSDHGEHVALPRRGATLEISMGYAGRAMVALGTYVVDEVEISGSPPTLTVRSRAANLRETAKSQHTRAWEGTTLGAILSAIAKEEGWRAQVHPTVSALPIVRADQANESNLHFMTRLGEQHGCIAKVAQGTLVVVPAGGGESGSGKPLGATIITPERCAPGWRVTLADRGKYKRVVASWHDPSTGRRVAETAGEGDPAYTLNETFSSSTSARRAAESRLAALERGKGTVSLEIVHGEPGLCAAGVIELRGFREGADGRWSCKRVCHKVTGGGGCSTAVEAESLQTDGSVAP